MKYEKLKLFVDLGNICCHESERVEDGFILLVSESEKSDPFYYFINTKSQYSFLPIIRPVQIADPVGYSSKRK